MVLVKSTFYTFFGQYGQLNDVVKDGLKIASDRSITFPEEYPLSMNLFQLIGNIDTTDNGAWR
jgi:hypothetical protein